MPSAGFRPEPHEHHERDEERAEQDLRREAAVADRLVLRAVEPRQEQERRHRQRHEQRAELLVGNGAQDCVVRREVPDRRDVLGRRRRIGRLEVRRFHEQAAERRHEEHDDGEQREEQADADDVLERVVRMERNAVDRLAVRAQVLLDLDAVRVVRTDLAQRDQVQQDEQRDDERQRDDVQREEARQRRIADAVVAADPFDEIGTDAREWCRTD